MHCMSNLVGCRSSSRSRKSVIYICGAHLAGRCSFAAATWATECRPQGLVKNFALRLACSSSSVATRVGPRRSGRFINQPSAAWCTAHTVPSMSMSCAPIVPRQQAVVCRGLELLRRVALLREFSRSTLCAVPPLECNEAVRDPQHDQGAAHHSNGPVLLILLVCNGPDVRCLTHARCHLCSQHYSCPPSYTYVQRRDSSRGPRARARAPRPRLGRVGENRDASYRSYTIAANGQFQLFMNTVVGISYQ